MEFIEQFQISAMTPPENQYDEAEEACSRVLGRAWSVFLFVLSLASKL